jgi:Flp pilus assembly protein TadD
LVVGLQGRFAEAETIAKADLPSDEAAANVAYLRQMLAQQNGLKHPAETGRPAVRAQGS